MAPARVPRPAMRVAVGIPSYREADSIAHVVAQADQGLVRLLGPARCVIVNVDGDSPDGTAEVFRATPTRCGKESFVCADQPGGKGRNVLRFFRYCADTGVEALATLDADVTSVTPDWIDALLTPVLDGRADQVTPLYTRSRFEGATTNHFAYPLLYGAYGRDIRQPIAGDFGLSGALVRHLLRQPVDDAVHGYGIDIFMSLHAAAGGFRQAQAPLGRKLHKPSFPKRARIFHDVVTAGVGVTRGYGLLPRPVEPSTGGCSIDDSEDYPHARQADELFEAMRVEAVRLAPAYRAWLGGEAADLTAALEAAAPRVSSDMWAGVLAGAVLAAVSPGCREPSHAFAERLAPLYMMRAITFWIENRRRDPRDVEAEVLAQARLFRRTLLARAGLTA